MRKKFQLILFQRSNIPGGLRKIAMPEEEGLTEAVSLLQGRLATAILHLSPHRLGIKSRKSFPWLAVLSAPLDTLKHTEIL